MIQWFPGHMAKAKKEIEEMLKLVDIVFELVDARIPISSQNPTFEDIFNRKAKLTILTKASLADDGMTKKWKAYFPNALVIDAISGLNVNKIVATAREILRDKLEKEKARGMKERAIKAMVIGIPNVGKSTLINRLVNKKVANVGNKPGVTKAQQWIRINKDLELLDTPGVLWPKFENERQGFHLALTGAIKDEIIHNDELILYLLDFFKKHYPDKFSTRYNVNIKIDNLEIIKKIGKSRGFIVDNDVDFEKTSDMILNDFRNGRIGKITLDRFNYD